MKMSADKEEAEEAEMRMTGGTSIVAKTLKEGQRDHLYLCSKLIEIVRKMCLRFLY